MLKYQSKSYFSITLSLFLCATLIFEEGLLFFFDPTSTFLSRLDRFEHTQSALNQGMLFYTPYNQDMLRVDDAFLFQLVLKHTHKISPPDLETSFRNDPFKRIFLSHQPLPNLTFHRLSDTNTDSLFKKNASYTISPSVEAFLRDPWDDLVLRSLYCDFGTYDEKDFQSLASLQDYSGGYFDTHFLLSILFLKEKNCFNQEILSQAEETVVQRIITAEKNDATFSDLYVERIVFLYWAGFGNTVQKEWIDMVKKNITSDPGWRTGGETFSNAHTTGLALLSLLYFQEGKAKQDWYK